MNFCRWYQSSNVKAFGISKKELLLAYFLAAATIFEPERTQERIMWAKTQIVSRMIKSFLSKENTLSLEEKTTLLLEFGHDINGLNKINRYMTLSLAYTIARKPTFKYIYFQAFFLSSWILGLQRWEREWPCWDSANNLPATTRGIRQIHYTSIEKRCESIFHTHILILLFRFYIKILIRFCLEIKTDIWIPCMHVQWSQWFVKLQQGEGDGGADAELLANTLNICAGHIAFNEDILSHRDYTTLSSLTTKICQRLTQIQDKKVIYLISIFVQKNKINIMHLIIN